MQDADALVSDMLIHGQRVHPDAAVAEFHGAATSSTSFADLAARAGRLAGALQGLGVGRDDVVATLCWNTAAHLAAYFAVPSIGAVLHILNRRLSDDQLAYIVNHAGDRVVIVDGDLVRQLARILPRCPGVRDASWQDLPRPRRVLGQIAPDDGRLLEQTRCVGRIDCGRVAADGRRRPDGRGGLSLHRGPG